MSYADMVGFREMQDLVKIMGNFLTLILARRGARPSNTTSGVGAKAGFDKFVIKFLKMKPSRYTGYKKDSHLIEFVKKMEKKLKALKCSAIKNVELGKKATETLKK